MKIPSWLSVSIFIVAFLGFLDATYLAAEYFLGGIPPCFITDGCDVVTTSVYSKIAGIPVALLGALHYLLILILWMYYMDKKATWVLTAVPALAKIGFLMSLYFLYVQIFVLQAYCSYCLVSAGTSIILWVLSILVWKRRKLPEQVEAV